MKETSEHNYDGLIIFSEPVIIHDDEDKDIKIYGLIYNKELRHADDLWQWQINRYICYLMGCQRIQEKNGNIAPELFITSDGYQIPLRDSTKTLIYKLLKEEMILYRIVESEKPFEIDEETCEDMFVISKSFIDKYGPCNTNEKREESKI